MTTGPPIEGRPPARLVLADGRVFEGVGIGADGVASGEVVFSTSMTGYQEALTDPSYGGQILTMTYPMQGNYGVNDHDDQSNRVQVRGFVVRELTDQPSHWQTHNTLNEYLIAGNVAGIAEIDTRALTRHLRTQGVVMGTVTRTESPEQALARLRSEPAYGSEDYVAHVSTDEAYDFDESVDGVASNGKGGPHIVVLDLGVKRNIMRLLSQRGCTVTAVPHTTDAEELMALAPDGIVFSPGPGDPMLLDHVVRASKGVVGKVPIMGI